MAQSHDETRRMLLSMLAATVPASAALAAKKRTELRTGQTSLAARSLAPASVLDHGAAANGEADDAPAFEAAIRSAKDVLVPPGRYRLSRTISLHDGQRIVGSGKSAWEPYDELGPFNGPSRSEILVDGIIAFDAVGTNSCKLEGLAFKGVRGRQSRFGARAGMQRGSGAVEITGSTQFEMRDVSFHGLEVAIDANQRSPSKPTQMPSFDDWSAQDCGTIFRFGTAQSSEYTVRDARISGCVIALHCDRMVEAHRCDGIRLENLRLFHASDRSVFIRDTPFVSIDSVTIFESGGDQLTLQDCVGGSLSGILLARAGAYAGAQPYPQRTALVLDQCRDIVVSGQFQQPTGKAIALKNCDNIAISGSIGTPFWTTGNLNTSDGAVRLEHSSSTSINASFGGSARDYLVSVWADFKSAMTLGGSISSDCSLGVVRATGLQGRGGIRARVTQPVTIAAGASLLVDEIRLLVPRGKSLNALAIAIDMLGARPRLLIDGIDTGGAWNAQREIFADGGADIPIGNIFLDNQQLFSNGGPTRWVRLGLALVNPSSEPLKIESGLEIRLSTTLV